MQLSEIVTTTKYVVALYLSKSCSWVNHLMVNLTKHLSVCIPRKDDRLPTWMLNYVQPVIMRHIIQQWLLCSACTAMVIQMHTNLIMFQLMLRKRSSCSYINTLQRTPAFRHERSCWSSYINTLQSTPAFRHERSSCSYINTLQRTPAFRHESKNANFTALQYEYTYLIINRFTILRQMFKQYFYYTFTLYNISHYELNCYCTILYIYI